MIGYRVNYVHLLNIKRVYSPVTHWQFIWLCSCCQSRDLIAHADPKHRLRPITLKHLEKNKFSYKLDGILIYNIINALIRN